MIATQLVCLLALCVFSPRAAASDAPVPPPLARFDIPLPRFDPGPLPEEFVKGGSDPDALGRALFPVTYDELERMADAIDRTFPRLVDLDSEELERAVREDKNLFAFTAAPAAVMLFANLNDTRLIMNWDFVTMGIKGGNKGGDKGARQKTLDVITFLQYPNSLRERLKKHLETKRHGSDYFFRVARALENVAPAKDLFAVTRPVLRAAMNIDTELSERRVVLDGWLRTLRNYAERSEEDWPDYFKLAYESSFGTEVNPLRRLSGFRETQDNNFSVLVLGIPQLARGWKAGLISDDVLAALIYRHLCVSFFRSGESLTSPFYLAGLELTAPGVGRIVQGVVDSVLAVETARDAEPTPVSGIASRLGRVEGVRHFVDIMAALQKNGGIVRRLPRHILPDARANVILSHLLRISHPAPGETPDSLKAALEEKSGDSRSYSFPLALAADFAPQWRGLITGVLDPDSFVYRFYGPTEQRKTPPPGFVRALADPFGKTPDMSPQALAARIGGTSGRVREIADHLFDRVGAAFAGDFPRFPKAPGTTDKFPELVGWKDDMAIGDVFRPGDELFQAVAAIAGPENARYAQRLWERAPAHPFTSPFRRGEFPIPRYRSKKLGCLYFNANFTRLVSFLAGLADGFTLDAFLREQSKGGDYELHLDPNWLVPAGRDFKDQGNFAPEYLALMLDEAENADEIFARTKLALASRMKNGKGVISIRELAGALVKSHRSDAHEHVARLLVDPMTPVFHLDEILEIANTGTVDALAAVVKGLSRIYPVPASVYLAASRWTGMKSPKPDSPFWGERGLELFFTFLSSRDSTYSRVGSTDSTLGYFAMWSLSQMDLDEALHALENLLRTGSIEQKTQALFWAAGLGNATLQGRLAILALKQPGVLESPVATAMALRCFGLEESDSSIRWGWPVRLTREDGAVGSDMAGAILLSDREFTEFEELLGRVAGTFPEGEKGAGIQRGGKVYTYDYFQVFYSREEVDKYREQLRKRLK